MHAALPIDRMAAKPIATAATRRLRRADGGRRLCGLVGVFVRLAAVPGVAAAFYRFAIAAVSLWPWCLRRARGATHRDVRSLLASVARVFFACDNALFTLPCSARAWPL